MATKEQVKTALLAIQVLAQAVKLAGQIPAGTLYAAVMSYMNVDTFDSFVARLVGAGLVRRDASHLLVWIGPA